MTEERIKGLIEKAKHSLGRGNNKDAKKFVLQAVVGLEGEKDNLVVGLPCAVTEQKLADWFGECALILTQTGDFSLSARYFYTAIIFDPEWKEQTHNGVADRLWNDLVYTLSRHVLQIRIEAIRKLLTEINQLAKLAEQQKKWRVAVVIDNDINQIYLFLRCIHSIGPRSIRDNPGRHDVPWRVARCLYHMGDHLQVKKLCSTILQEFCEYDNPEAFELWSRALIMSGDYDIALSKCRLGLKYAKTQHEITSLSQLEAELTQKLSEIETNKQSLDYDWLKETAVSYDRKALESRPSSPENQTFYTKRRHKRPKARCPSSEFPMPHQAPPVETSKNTSFNQTGSNQSFLLYQRTNTQERGNKNVEGRSEIRKQSGHIIKNTPEPSIVYESAFPDSESDEYDDTETDDSASSEEDMCLNEDVETISDETATFYEQSRRFHNRADPLEETDIVSDEKLLRDGITLSSEYMRKLDAELQKRNQRSQPFYSEPIDKETLQKKLTLNPKSHIRCIIHIKGPHEAYCTPVESSQRNGIIEISGRSKIGQVFNDDEVVVELLKDKKEMEKRFGKVLGVLNRQKHKNTEHPVFLCTLDAMDSNFVKPMCKTIPKIHVMDKEIRRQFDSKMKRFKMEIYPYDAVQKVLCKPKIVDINPSGQNTYVFLVAFLSWSPKHSYPTGAVLKMIDWGHNIPKGLELLHLQHEVPCLYRKETVHQVDNIYNQEINEPYVELLNGRTDLTHLNTFTIDPAGSMDLDDALSIEPHQTGYKIGVHIADVTRYVTKDDPIDTEARTRATTFYPGIRKPRHMLPEPLSTDLCSLLPGKTRLTLSVFFLVDEKGQAKSMEGDNYKICESYIRSKVQLTYNDVQTILKEGSVTTGQISKDILLLFQIAKSIRERRLGRAMFAVEIDWEENLQGESNIDTAEAHYLVEEYMIMTNKKIAEYLIRKFPQVVPLRCQPPPTKEGLQEFAKLNGNFIDTLVRLQDRMVIDRKRGVDLLLSQHKDEEQNVIVSKELWVKMKADPKFATTCLQKDDLFPLQHLVYQHWMSIQERACYRCSGSANKEDATHYTLGYYQYSHFTSPIRRYNDIIVHRLLRARLHGEACPYSTTEIDELCVQLKSVTKKATDYQRGCNSLQQAIEFHKSPKMVKCYVDEIDDKGVTLCSPLLKHVKKKNRKLTFNRLDMGTKPIVSNDRDTNWPCVTAMWRKRIYDHQGKAPNYQPDGGQGLTLNTDINAMAINISAWARLLKAAADGRQKDVGRILTTIQGHQRTAKGLHDVSTECMKLELLQPNTKFTTTFRRGQTVTVQMSAIPTKGMMVPRPMFFRMTNNVGFCLQHTEDPVLHLYRYVTRSTCDTYKDIKRYLARWIPLILMEAATGIVRNEESCSIKNVPIKFTNEKKGKFALSLAHSETRNIEFSGTQNDEDADDENGGAFDWLCLKTPIPGVVSKDIEKKLLVDQSYWVGHAEVCRVVKKESRGQDGKLEVSFNLHDKTKSLPYEVKKDATFDIEILRKSEVDRRTESIIKELRTKNDSIAAKIALNKKIPDLDRDHAHIVSLIERDLYFVESTDDPRRKALPQNNVKQQEAIDKALRSRFTLIQGPPGTGKTNTGIKLMYLFDKINNTLHKEGKPRKQVLFCGPSNKSVDLVARWLYNRMGKFSPDFVRVYGRSIEALDFPIPGRTFLSKRSTHSMQTDPELKKVSLHHLIREKGKKYAEEINAYDKLFKDKKYTPMPEKVKHYVHLIREASIAEIRRHDVILCTTSVGSNPKVLQATSVHQVIVDEAGMCPEPQCLVPIIASGAEQVVLIGDHKQLRPIIMCRAAGQLGLETSLFERYAMTKCSSNVQYTMLNKQYRMHPHLCEFSSKQFYKGQLKSDHKLFDRSSLYIWPRNEHGKIYPNVLVHVEGEEQTLTVSTEEGNEKSKSNLAEVDVVVKLYDYLMKQTSEKTVILSQYNAQCALIKQKLRVKKIQSDPVSTVVSSQGGEWDYVIFSTVRSLPEYKIEKNPTGPSLGWCKRNLGFITDENQMNVALTRAKKGLIIVGNKHLLACDRNWRKLIEHYDRNGCVTTPDKFPPPDSHRSRMQIQEESQRRTKERFGKSMYEKGEATFYEGPFDIDDDDDDEDDEDEFEGEPGGVVETENYREDNEGDWQCVPPRFRRK